MKFLSRRLCPCCGRREAFQKSRRERFEVLCSVTTASLRDVSGRQETEVEGRREKKTKQFKSFALKCRLGSDELSECLLYA
ncbi:uncharacterized [Tachysurus ichikawai]